MKTVELLTAALLAAVAAQAAETKPAGAGPIEAVTVGPAVAELGVYRAVWRALVDKAIERGKKTDLDGYTAWEKFIDKLHGMPPKTVTGRGYAFRELRHRRGDVSHTFKVSGRVIGGEFRAEEVSIFHRVKDVTHQSFFAEVETGRLTGAVRMDGFGAMRIVELSVDDPAVREAYATQLRYWVASRL